MSVYLQDGLVLLNGGSVATDEACCCGCLGELVTFQIDYTWTLTVDDTRCFAGSEPCLDVQRCALHFSDGGSFSHTVTETLPDWGEFFVDFFYDDSCPGSPSGVCSRSGISDYFSGNVGVNIGAGNPFCGCTCVCAATAWNLGCTGLDPVDCTVTRTFCGASDSPYKTQDADLCHPEGIYHFSDSFSSTHYSWAWTLDFTITRL